MREVGKTLVPHWKKTKEMLSINIEGVTIRVGPQGVPIFSVETERILAQLQTHTRAARLGSGSTRGSARVRVGSTRAGSARLGLKSVWFIFWISDFLFLQGPIPNWVLAFHDELGFLK